MFKKHRILNEKTSFSLRHPILFVFLGLSLFVSAADRAYGDPIPEVGCDTNDATYKTKGCWKDVFSSGPIAHATVLPDGNVLHWSSFPPHGYARMWNCSLVGDANKKLCSLSTTNQDIWFTDMINIFCSGHSLMSDGKVIITGGTKPQSEWPEFAEARTIRFNYNPASGQSPWETSPTMYEGRWYPTNVALGNGGTLTASGTYWDQGTSQTVVNDVPEILPTPTSSSWTRLTGAGNLTLPLYPWLYYASNGKVFYAGPTQYGRWLDITGTGAWLATNNSTLPAPAASSTYRESGSSVMYDVDKVMVSGGGPVSPVATNEVMDLATPAPSPAPTPRPWQTVAPMAFARKHHNLTIMADGKILATGGTKGVGFNNNCERQVVYDAEIWTPSTGPSDSGSWSTMAKMTYTRRYHSTAFLLRDGRIMVGGSDLYPSTPTQCNPPLPFSYTTEIFTPPYLFDQTNGGLAARPRVTSVPGGGSPGAPFNISYGTQFSIGMADSTTISKVTMIRLSSVTHSFNMNQRINYLSVSQSGSNLTITPPANSNIAPPGHYFMFVISSAGVPSVAEVVKIS